MLLKKQQPKGHCVGLLERSGAIRFICLYIKKDLHCHSNILNNS